jgi:hypothetical protein
LQRQQYGSVVPNLLTLEKTYINYRHDVHCLERDNIDAQYCFRTHGTDFVKLPPDFPLRFDAPFRHMTHHMSVISLRRATWMKLGGRVAISLGILVAVAVVQLGASTNIRIMNIDVNE